MPGPIATEVVEELRAGPAVPVRPTEPVPIRQDPSSGPISVIAKNIPKTFSATWWFEKGGPLGILCFAFLGSAAWMANSQEKSQAAVLQMMRDEAQDRRDVMKMLMTTQAQMAGDLSRLARTMERLEAKLDGKKDD